MFNLKPGSQWHNVLSDEFKKTYFIKLLKFISKQTETGEIIYPKAQDIFNALNSTPLEKVKVVILGQDPYHGLDQANGLSFSVNKGIPIPPSLRNIYKEMNQDISFSIPKHGDLKSWSKQGVLLLNSVLTVNQSDAGSHRNQGWEIFTDQIIAELNKQKNIVYLLWGSYAQKKGASINSKNNLILKSVHPSPLSAYRGFLGCKHFSQCNEYLHANNIKAINWQID